MRVKLIGVGAAGNKATICAVQESVVKKEDVLLINSTLKDIPKDFDGLSYQFNIKDQDQGGCGKERRRAANLVTNDIEEIPLEKFLGVGTPEEAELAIIVCSTEGGTGSGASPILARYIWQALGIHVHMFAFLGFGEDVRGLRNTVEYFGEMDSEFTIEAIDNSRYLTECNGNRIKAEKKANSDFCRKIAILIGNVLRDSEHNIDPRDLYKISTYPGYMVIEFKEFSKIKNREQFRAMVIQMLDDSKALDVDGASQQKMGVMINIDKDNTDVIDYQDILVERYGMVFEKFEHIQHEGDMPNFFAVISAGSKMPKDEIDAVYTRYTQLNKTVDKKKDTFFNTSYKFEAEDDDFDVKTPKKMGAKAFLESVKTNKRGNNEVKGDVSDNY